jgi:hypothetical protein
MSRTRISTTISSSLACLLLLTLAKAEPHDPRSKSEDDALDADTASKPALVWVCEEWVELWQGSGRARTCEWRPAAPAEPLR